MRFSSKTALSSAVVVVIFVALATGMFGAFYVGQNSVRIITVTENVASTTQTVTTTATSTSFVTVTKTVTSSPVSSGSNVVTVTMTSATLYASGSFQFVLSNPGSQTKITSVVLTSGSGASLTISNASDFTINGVTGVTAIAGGQTSSVVLNLVTTTLKLNPGQTYGFVVAFTNGQSITGSVVAQ